MLATRRPSQRAQVMALGGELQVLTQPIQDAGALRAAVENIQPGDSHGNFGELGRGMRALTETVHTPVDLHLFSDMQSSNMPVNFADMVMPGNVSLVLHPVATALVPNWTVESVDAPGLLVDPEEGACAGGHCGASDSCGYASGFARDQRSGVGYEEGGCGCGWEGDGCV